jgi:hypothetical protein
MKINLKHSRFSQSLFWFIFFALLCAFALMSHVALAQVEGTESTKIENNIYVDLLKLGGSLTVSGLLLMGIYYLAQYLIQQQKEAKENEKILEQRNVTLENEKTSLLKEHSAMLEKQNERLVSTIKESYQHNEKILDKYLAETEKNRMFFANEYEKQRAMYEKYYTELRLEINSNSRK